MRKLIMWNVITLDGCFEGPQPWDLTFHSLAWGPEMEALSLEQLRNADYLLFGRNTYEGLAAYWTSSQANDEHAEITQLMNRIKKLVVSTTLTTAQWQNTTLLNANFIDEIKKLKQQEGKDIYVFGSGILSQTLIQENLFDEFRMAIAPTLLGNGRKQFTTQNPTTHLQLYESTVMQNGTVILKYKNKSEMSG